MTRWVRVLVPSVLLLCLTTGIRAHPLAFTETTLTLTSDGRFVVDMLVDLDALALGAPQDTDDAELVAALRSLAPEDLDELVNRLARLFIRRVRVRFDDQPAPFVVSFPDHATPRATEAEIPTVLGLTARLSGTTPPDAAEVEFFASRAFSDVHLSVIDESRALTRRSILERGARSDPFELTGPARTPSRAELARDYLTLGFVHIVPEGLDHILFVLGLFLFSTRLGPLVTQVTAFTVAHALTLALGALDVITLPPRPVEVLIALSIAWVGIENVLRPSHPGRNSWRPAVVFLFGLLHGLGFAGVLRELGLPPGERLLGLVFFNVGIELGQLVVVTAAMATLGWYRRRAWYRGRIVVPLSLLIALVGVAWAWERVAA